ncbi:MAG: ABC transporter ATP-binding protein [Acetobacteraceae bacterium]|nr:ABC transporter ATP-binding protein [Acetobacteraceae bacterium]
MAVAGAQVVFRLEGATLGYRSVAALDGMSLEVERGAFLGIIGANGSGKTTLLRALGRALPPSRGRVYLEGRDLWSLSQMAVARRVGAVSQEERVDFAFTVEEVVLMGRFPHRRGWRETPADLELARKAMARVGLSGLEGRLWSELSGGERQKVAIARALAQEPEVLLLDEPTSHLDISHQLDIMDLLRQLNRERRLTVLAALHDLNLASAYCDRLVLLHRGRVRALGPPEEVLAPGTLREVYGADVWVQRHPVHGRPYLIPVPPPPVAASDAPGARVHLVAGGGSAAGLLPALAARGYSLSLGVLNVGDSDWERARVLGAEVVEAPPFSPVDPASARQALDLMLKAQAVVVAPVPFGLGNLPNLEAVEEAVRLRPGLAVAVVEAGGDGGGQARDYTGGRALAALARLRRAGAEVVAEAGLWQWLEAKVGAGSGAASPAASGAGGGPVAHGAAASGGGGGP